MKIKDRNYGIDVVRVIAVISVLSVHFFLNTNYYNTSPYSFSMDIQGIIRNFFMICVPLFLLITGYLNNKLEYNKSFFKSLFDILIIWFFYSIIEYFTLNIMNGDINNLNIKDLLFSITSFKACGYSWYIEMYIGLYLFSPLLNNAYNSFNKKNRLYLLLITISVIIVPNFINNIFEKVIHLPNWWNSIYPIAYYICGKYIADKKPKINKNTLFILLILTQILTYSYKYITIIDYNSLTTFVSATIIFLIFYNIELKNKFLKSIIKYISVISLDIYLASSLIDKIMYPIFNNIMNDMNIGQNNVILYAPIILGITFTLSIIYGSIRKLIIKVR